MDKNDGKYEVMWMGYDNTANSWKSPADLVNCPEALIEFVAKQQGILLDDVYVASYILMESSNEAMVKW